MSTEIEKTVEQQPEIDIEKILTEKLAEQERKFNEKLKEELRKKDEELQKQFDETILEIAKSKEEKPIEPKKVEVETKSEFETLAEKIKAKREEEKIAREKAEEDEEKETLRKQLQAYKLKDELDKIKKQEPYLADIIDEGISEGSITSIDQINMIFNDTLKNKLKASYQFEKAIKESGGDPMSYLQDNNIMTDEVAKKKHYQDLVAKKKAKYGIK